MTATVVFGKAVRAAVALSSACQLETGRKATLHSIMVGHGTAGLSRE